LIALDKSEYQVGELQGLYCEITLGAVIQSFWLTAHSLGLAMQWVKPALEQSAAKAAIIDQLGIPDTHDPVALFRLGYYQTPPVTASEPVHPFQTLIHADQWGNPAPAGLTDSPSLLWKPK
jgi:nitroreductase